MSAFTSPLIRSLCQLAATVLTLGMMNVALATEAQQLWVSNRGVDSSTCGVTTRTACRSISQAITNATDGDTILVGPGKYGDLNNDGDRSDPGEESSGEAGDTAVVVNKRLRVLSTHGALATVLDFGDAQEKFAVVLITADGAIFGSTNRGFTVMRGHFGVVVDFLAGNVRVAGNIALNNDPDNGGGFFAEPSHGKVYLSNNIATGSYYGFLIEPDSFGGPSFAVVEGNTALSNRGPGFLIQGTFGHQIIGNTANSNGGAGFDVQGRGHLVQGNLSVSNSTGFSIFGFTPGVGSQTFLRNAAVGNDFYGFNISSGVINVVIRENNIYGNRGLPPFCGLINTGNSPVDARNNFWGQSNGPAGCQPGGPVLLKPFATAAFAVNPPQLGP